VGADGPEGLVRVFGGGGLLILRQQGAWREQGEGGGAEQAGAALEELAAGFVPDIILKQRMTGEVGEWRHNSKIQQFSGAIIYSALRPD
jgi:hypothetical protein